MKTQKRTAGNRPYCAALFRGTALVPLLAVLVCLSCSRRDEVRPAVAAERVAVALDGVVTYVDTSGSQAVVQGTTRAVTLMAAAGDIDVAVGDQVTVTGWTSASDSTPSPTASTPTITKRGTRDLPDAIPLPLTEIDRTRCDGRRVDVLGTVIRAGMWDGTFRLELAEGDKRLEVRVGEVPVIHFRALVGSLVRARGACVPAPTSEATSAAFRLLVSRFADLTLSRATRAAIQPSATLPVLDEAALLRQLPPVEAERRYPVRLRGVVTYYDKAWSMLFVQDSTAGAFVQAVGLTGTFTAGDRVEVRGWSDPGNYAPEVVRATVRRLGRAPMPLAKEVGFERLLTGSEDSQWVQGDGVVRTVSRTDSNQLLLQVVNGRSRFPVLIPAHSGPVPTELVGSVVRIAGVSGTLFNRKRQLIGIQYFVPSMDYIRAERRAPPDPFAVPIAPIDRLTQFAVGSETSPRVRFRGTVTLRRSASFFVKDATGSVEVRLAAPDLSPGDEVDVVGFTASGEYSAVVEDPLVRRVGRGEMPAPTRVTAEQTLTGNFDGELVRIRARLVERGTGDSTRTLVLQDASHIFNAVWDDAPGEWPAAPGSIVELVGICLVQVDLTHAERAPRGFTLLLQSPAHVTVVEAAPWWTVTHTLLTVGVLGAVTIVALAWVVVLLRRRVRRQIGHLQEAKDAAEAAGRARSELLARVS